MARVCDEYLVAAIAVLEETDGDSASSPFCSVLVVEDLSKVGCEVCSGYN